MKIMVRDNNVEQALRVMKKKMQREGLFRQLKQGEAFEKPSEKRIRERAEAVRRARKAQRKKLQREGLLPMPKLKPRAPRPGQPVNREPFNPSGPQASAIQKG